MSNPDSQDTSPGRIEYQEFDHREMSRSLANHLEGLLDEALLSTKQRDELIRKLQEHVRNDPRSQIESKEQILLMVKVTLAHEFQLAEPFPRIWSRTAENVAVTLWNHRESRSRLEKMWQQLRAGAT